MIQTPLGFIDMAHRLVGIVTALFGDEAYACVVFLTPVFWQDLMPFNQKRCFLIDFYYNFNSVKALFLNPNRSG